LQRSGEKGRRKLRLRGRRSSRQSLARVLLLISLLLVLALALPPFPAEYQELRADLSLRITDRHGRPLRSLLSTREGMDSWVPLQQVAPELVAAVLASEDSRFAYHPGVDPLAVARAVRDNLRAGRVVSGASTITAQLLRTLSPSSERGVSAKLRESYWAIRLEALLEKEEILEAYLNRVAFGPTVYGVEEAARYYFNKPAQSVSLAEAALLAVLIRAPVGFDPWTEEGQAELKPWIDQLLQRMEQDGLVTAEAAQRARAQSLRLSDLPAPFRAPHFCDLVLPQLHGLRGEQRTSLDLELQYAVEGMISNHLRLLQGHRVDNVAVLVADVESGEVLALAGSANYHRARDGQHNAATALRQPGSTLKPFTYALLLEKVGQAGYVLPDLPVYQSSHRASFIPRNYDERFHGPVSLRQALGSSYNVPAVRALEQVGVEKLLLCLRDLGMTELKETPDHYGLGLTLGDGSVSLWQLVEAYRTLAQGGRRTGPLSLLHPAPVGTNQRQLFSPGVASIVTDVLSDRQARIPSFGTPNVLEFAFPVAVKTGTSKGYRDNWCVGYTPRHVVGVWVGNSDGSPMERVSGISGAGPLFRDVMLALGDGGDFPAPPGPSVAICSLSGGVASDSCPNSTLEPCLPEIPVPRCQACQRVVVDARTGQPAGPEVPAEFRLEQLRFALDPIYGEWARENSLPLLEPRRLQEDGFRLVFPLDGDTFLHDHDVRGSHQKVRLRVAGGRGPYRWTVDEADALPDQGPEAWWPLRPGEHRLSVQDADGRRDSLTVRVVGAPQQARPNSPSL
jgi:penicillin-binding protein 1C